MFKTLFNPKDPPSLEITKKQITSFQISLTKTVVVDTYRPHLRLIPSSVL